MSIAPLITILRNAFIIYLTATTVNLVIYFIALSLGFSLKGTQYEAFNPVVLYGSSFAFSVLGTLVFIFCRRLFQKNSDTIFSILGIIFIFFAGFPLLGQNLGTLELVYFEVSHLVLGFPFIYFMIKGSHDNTSLKK
jgi:Family of unknown function (DUF6069)